MPVVPQIQAIEVVPGGAVAGQVLGRTAQGNEWVDAAVLSNATPLPAGNPVPGTSPDAARSDHVHPDKGIYYGVGFPSNALGGDGASYIDTAAGKIYGPKAGGAWPGTYFSLGARLP